MKSIKSILFIIVAGLSLSSCEKYLDTVPKGKIVPTSVSDFEYLLRDEKTMSKGFQNPLYMTDEVYFPDNVYNSRVDRPIAINGYTWTQPLYDVNENDQDWRWLYSQIWTCNYILERVDDAPLNGLSEEARSNVKAQALVSRATSYFFMVNLYGKHYDPSSASSDLAVPIVTSTDIGQMPYRSTVQEVYDFVFSDLDIAFNLFTYDQSDISYKPSKVAIYGLRARIALLMEEWDVAFENAQMVLNIKNDLWDYNEYIGITPTTILRASHAVNNIEAVFTRSNYWFYTSPLIFTTYIADDLRQLFSADDLRLQFFGTYEAQYDSYNYNLYWYAELGITVPEMYLIIAETHARAGNTLDAMAVLNTLLVKRIDAATYVPATAADAAEALNIVLTERRKELMFTGLRWLDQRRLIKTGDFTTTVSRTLNGTTLYLEPIPENYIINIPEDIQNFNPNIL
jgi:hypothetical protein